MTSSATKRLLQSDWTRVLSAATVGSFALYTSTKYLQTDVENIDQAKTKSQFLPISISRRLYAESVQQKVAPSKNTCDPSTAGKRKKVVHMRFDKFASMVYTNGELIMTPMDFIESVTQSQPRPRIGRRQIKEKDLDSLLRNTPKPVNNYSRHDFFQKLDMQGVITFPEYCFLVACLGKTRSDIAIAYKTFDRDNSSKIEKPEFVQFAVAIKQNAFPDKYERERLEQRYASDYREPSFHLYHGSPKEKRQLKANERQFRDTVIQLIKMKDFSLYSNDEDEDKKRKKKGERYRNRRNLQEIKREKRQMKERSKVQQNDDGTWRSYFANYLPLFASRTPITKIPLSGPPKQADKSSEGKETNKNYAVAESMVDLGSESIPRSTLTQHFFGKDGRGKLGYEQFLSFIRSLQTEILLVEFTEFSKGLKTISEDEFARILLRHTNVPSEQQQLMMQNVINTGSTSFKGITFEEFSEFFYFLNNIEDFSVAVKVYSYAGQNLDKAAFQRAYKVTTHGKEIPNNILDTIFLLFDVNNDGELSRKEFIGQMKDAVQRGFRYHKQDFKGIAGFKQCVAHEMKMGGS
ncbi:calcium uptake protein 3, mitochondrial-like isoform X1 [Convolutriloba macropyga]|uniref:calcium uptake protein 3, mitochondrial-like isoform X1 n=1 Tax=Convolutriloba macropyga TaxID=536237 RepID=UPI003F52393A